VQGSPNATVQTPNKLQKANFIMLTRYLEGSADRDFFGVWGFVICDFSRDETLTCLT
jgi:hypothetical protein